MEFLRGLTGRAGSGMTRPNRRGCRLGAPPRPRPPAAGWTMAAAALALIAATWTTAAGSAAVSAKVAPPRGIGTVTVVTDGSWVTAPDARPVRVECTYSKAWTTIAGASWIWADRGQTACLGAPGAGPGSLGAQSATLTKTFTVPGRPQGAVLQIAADNSAVVYLNGTMVDEVTGFGAATVKDFSGGLRQGKNTFEIVGTNDPSGPYNPAGVIARLTVSFATTSWSVRGQGNWAAHLPRPFTPQIEAYAEFDPLFIDPPTPPFMFQGTSYGTFLRKDLGSGFFTFCAQGARNQSRACPDLARATDPVLQRLLAEAYPGAKATIGGANHLGRAVIGDGSVGNLLGFDMYMGRWTTAAQDDAQVLSLMRAFETYVRNHQSRYGTCSAVYGKHADINLRVACTSYWELEVYHNLYDSFVHLPALCIAAYRHTAAKSRLAAEHGCFLGNSLMIATDDVHDLIALDPIPNVQRADPAWSRFMAVDLILDPTPFCPTSLASIYYQGRADQFAPRDSVSDFTNPEVPVGPAPVVWPAQMQEIWDLATQRPTPKGGGPSPSSHPKGTWNLRSVSCPV